MSIELGRFGIWTSYRSLGEENGAEAAQLVERLGYGALWMGGSLSPERCRPLLDATERLIVATGITNVWADDPRTVAAQCAQLQSDYPDRFLLGVGIGHPEATSEYKRPLTAMRNYLDGLDAASDPVAVNARCLAALGPKMLDLSGERSLGTHPYFTSASHTRFSRERLGPGALVAPEMGCVVDPDPETARATARGFASRYLGLTNYTGNLLRFEFDESDIADGGSDRLIDAVIPHGSADDVAAAAQVHVDAGADHVCLQTVGLQGVPTREWTALASALELG